MALFRHICSPVREDGTWDGLKMPNPDLVLHSLVPDEACKFFFRVKKWTVSGVGGPMDGVYEGPSNPATQPQLARSYFGDFVPTGYGEKSLTGPKVEDEHNTYARATIHAVQSSGDSIGLQVEIEGYNQYYRMSIFDGSSFSKPPGSGSFEESDNENTIYITPSEFYSYEE